MSVLIKGMEMPTNCWEDDCPCLNKQYGFCQADDDKGFVYSNKPEWCPLSPVPKHGRLADLDKIENEIAQLAPEDYTTGSIRLILDYAPTIIPAEEDGCGRCDHCRINETGTCRYAEEES